MTFDNPQENDGQRNEDDSRSGGDAGMLLRMMDPRMRMAAGMSGDTAAERTAEEGPAAPSTGSIGNRIVEIQGNVPGVIPRQNGAQDEATDVAPPDLRVVDVQRAQSMKDLPAELFKPSAPAPVLARQDGAAVPPASEGQAAAGEARSSANDRRPQPSPASEGGKSAGGAAMKDSGNSAPPSPTSMGQGSGQAPAAKADAGSPASAAKVPGEKPKARTDNFYAYATVASKLPAENRGVYLMRLHDVLTQNFLRSGKMVGPDGKMYSAESPRQVEGLVKQWVDGAMQDYREANPYGTRTTAMPPEQKPKWEDQHWILSGLKNSIPEIKKLPGQALHTLKKQMSFDEHKPGEKADPDMLPDPANLLDDKHWIMKGLMHTVYDPNRNANDVVRAAGRGLDPLVKGLTGGVVDLREGELHRPGKALVKMALGGQLPPEVIDRIYAAMPEHTKSLWNTANGNSIYGKDVDLNVDLKGAKKSLGPAGRWLLPDEFNVQRGFDALGKATGEFVRDKGIGKAVNGAIKGSELLKTLVENPKTREILRTVLKEATTSALGKAGETDVDENGKRKGSIAVAALKGAGRGLGMETKMRFVRPVLGKIAGPEALAGTLSKPGIPAAVARSVRGAIHKEGGPAMAALLGVLKEARAEHKEEIRQKK